MIKIAGGVIWNPRRGIAVVNQNNNSWSLPKGHVEDGETDIEAALREIKEETGIDKEDLVLVRPFAPYIRARIKKNTDDTDELRTISFFFFTTDRDELNPEDPENPEAVWMDPNEVADALSHPKDKEFFRDILKTTLTPYVKDHTSSLFS